MGKAFSETEMRLIRDKLIESCQKCWMQYGYRKTSVSEICAMSGISKGSFYAFYPAKEMLFLETANNFTDRITRFISENVPRKPNKYDMAKILKSVFGELCRNKWFIQLREDYDLLMRKLPDGHLEKEYKKDILNVSSVLKLYRTKTKVPKEVIGAIVYVLFFSLYFSDTIGKHHQNALNLLIDCIVGKLFE